MKKNLFLFLFIINCYFLYADFETSPLPAKDQTLSTGETIDEFARHYQQAKQLMNLHKM